MTSIGSLQSWSGNGQGGGGLVVVVVVVDGLVVGVLVVEGTESGGGVSGILVVLVTSFCDMKPSVAWARGLRAARQQGRARHNHRDMANNEIRVPRLEMRKKYQCHFD
jgi:hypothetical protein